MCQRCGVGIGQAGLGITVKYNVIVIMYEKVIKHGCVCHHLLYLFYPISSSSIFIVSYITFPSTSSFFHLLPPPPTLPQVNPPPTRILTASRSHRCHGLADSGGLGCHAVHLVTGREQHHGLVLHRAELGVVLLGRVAEGAQSPPL